MNAKSLIFGSLFLFTSCLSMADVAVIVNSGNSADISKKDVVKIFLGKKKSFSDGSQAKPINLIEGNKSRAEFNSVMLGKTNSQFKAYWSSLIFTGKGVPPEEIDSDQEVLEMIASDPRMIGYVDASVVDDSVKVIYKF